jgi:flagellar secretion chaperone FliS
MVPQKNPQAAQQYLKTRVMTATPEQLQIMLYDGAIRFCEMAKAGLEKKNLEQVHINVSKAQKIITELLGNLKPEVYPELCGKLAAVYNYVYKRLIEAGIEHKKESLQEAIDLMRFQRETWALMLDQLSKEKAGKAIASINVPGPDPRMEASISMSA